MSKALYVIICIFASIGMIVCLFGIVRMAECFCDDHDKLQSLCNHSEFVDNRIEGIHEILKFQKDEIKLLKERIDIYEKSNSED